ncbi:MAG: putative LPS assembly protein LptD, partial [Candidatus Binatia bacterium]
MMIRTRHIFLGLTLVLLLLQAIPVLGQGAQPTVGEGEEKIEITADESITGIEGGIKIEAKGNVKIIRGETILKADEIKMNRKTTDVEAKGNVSMEDPQGTLKADAVRLNLSQETGEIENGDIFFKEYQLSVSGKRLQKLSGQRYQIDEGFFTTCLCKSGPPSWKISADKIELTPEGEGIITNGYFYIFDIPVFYLPYAYVPVKTERKSGFLFPKIGTSSDDGFRYEQPFFWAISKSSDATFGINVETDSRIGLLGEYRTVLSQNASARANFAYFNEGFRNNAAADIVDKTIADPHIPVDRWTAIATHRHTPSASWMTYSDIFAFSDDLFTRELVDRFDLAASRERDIRRSRFGSSRFGFLKSWDDTYLRGEWKFFQ